MNDSMEDYFFEKAEELMSYKDISNKLANALQSLYDYQNGCPLPKYKKGWTKAMKDSNSALQRYNRFYNR